MNFLVTGSDGYIGSHLVRFLKNKYEHAYVHEWDIEQNITDWSLVERYFPDEPIDCIFHLAALSNVEEGNTTPYTLLGNNVLMTQNMIDISIRNRVRNFIFASSASIYADNLIDEAGYTEDSPLKGIAYHPYGVSKIIGEQLLKLAKKEYGLKTCSVRFANVAGEAYGMVERHFPETHLIPKLVHRDPNKVFEIYGTDKSRRDYVHIEDVCEGLDFIYRKMAYSPELVPQAINLGTGIGHTIRNVIDTFEYLVGETVNTRIAEPRAGDASVSILNNSVLKKLGFTPSRGIKEIISSYKDLKQ